MTATSSAPADHHAIAAGLEGLIGLLRVLSPGGGLSLTTASTLHRLNTAGPSRLSDLAAGEGVTQPAMTQLVSRLQRQGLAERRGHQQDRRVVMVHITEAGSQLLGQRRTHRAAALTQLLARLPAEDERSIAAALPALGRLAAMASSDSERWVRP